ncbi:MAG: hypothetical protein OEZ06_28020 [Myxococcales bacterium]|nr:hypothetical protein [Myxococcales bacterium]
MTPNNISIQRLAESRGVQLRKKQGGILVGRCSFHGSRNLTLRIDSKSNTWSCTGKCRAKDKGAVEWVMKAEGISKKHAVELLKQGYLPGDTTSTVKKTTTKKLDTFEVELPDDVLLSKVVEFYTHQLRESPVAQQWLRDHNLNLPEMVEALGIGFADRSLGYRLPERNRKAGRLLRGQLTQLGILRPSGHEHFRGCLTIPITNEHDQVVNIYGHRIGRTRSGEPTELWLHDDQRGIFNLGGITGPDAVITADIMDALAVWCSGIASVTVATESTDDLTALLKARNVERVLLAHPRTDDGQEAAQALAEALSADGFTVMRVVFPQGLGPLTFTREAKVVGRPAAL